MKLSHNRIFTSTLALVGLLPSLANAQNYIVRTTGVMVSTFDPATGNRVGSQIALNGLGTASDVTGNGSAWDDATRTLYYVRQENGSGSLGIDEIWSWSAHSGNQFVGDVSSHLASAADQFNNLAFRDNKLYSVSIIGGDLLEFSLSGGLLQSVQTVGTDLWGGGPTRPAGWTIKDLDFDSTGLLYYVEQRGIGSTGISNDYRSFDISSGTSGATNLSQAFDTRNIGGLTLIDDTSFYTDGGGSGGINNLLLGDGLDGTATLTDTGVDFSQLSGGNDFAGLTATPIPEPSSPLLLGTVFLGLLKRRRAVNA